MDRNLYRAVSIMLFFSAPLLLSQATSAVAAGLRPETLKAWSDYVKRTENRITAERLSGEGFLSLDFKDPSKAAEERRSVLSGSVLVEQVDAGSGNGLKIPDGLIHHWRGFVFIPGVDLDSVLYKVKNPTAESMKQEDVLDSRVLERAPGKLRLFLKLQRSKIVTVVYNTEHLVRYGKCSLSRAWSSSVATRIREVEDPGAKDEREKPAGEDSGFLWKLNSYWRYQQINAGVIVECESITLSRPIPFLLSPVAGPLIRGVARESMERTLRSLRTRVLKRDQPAMATKVQDARRCRK